MCYSKALSKQIENIDKSRKEFSQNMEQVKETFLVCTALDFVWIFKTVIGVLGGQI